MQRVRAFMMVELGRTGQRLSPRLGAASVGTESSTIGAYTLDCYSPSFAVQMVS